MIKGVIFDLYGTLINANHLFLPIAEIISNEIGQSAGMLEKKIKETYNYHFKNYHLKPFKPEREYYKLLFNKLKENLNLKNSIDYYIDEMYKTFINLKPYDDIEYLNTIKEKGLKIVILTNADNDFVLPSLKKNKIPFDVLITSHSTKLYKPDPKIFDYTLNKIKLNKDEVIFIGDNYNVDILGGINYGIKSILIKRISSNLDYPDTIYSLKELTKYIH